MKQSEYLRYDATALAELVRRGEVTAQEVRDAAVARANVVNPLINAICDSQFDEPLVQGSGPTPGPLQGAPILLKDLGQAQAGRPCTFGSRSLTRHLPTQDSEYVRRIKRAGLSIIGRTATPEFGFKGITEPELWGPCRNPWDRNLSPGGSSGGSAAAVAAGIVPVAGANDGGGSIRIPAGYCGLFGLKPSRGRVSHGPQAGDIWTGASEDHVVSRTVRDSAILLDTLAGPASGDPFRITPPATAYRQALEQPPRQLRIGLFTASPYDTEVSRDCIEAVESTARTLENLGHRVEIAAPEIDGKTLVRCYTALNLGEVSAMVDWAKQAYKARDDDFELDTRIVALLAREFPLSDYVRLRQRWNEFARALGGFFESFDLYMCPTTGALPPAIGALGTPGHLKVLGKLMVRLGAGRTVKLSGQLEAMTLSNLAYTPFTQLANLTGTPAMSVPMHWTGSGLPVGVQFGAAHGQEDLLLQLAAQLEEANPWFGHYERLDSLGV